MKSHTLFAAAGLFLAVASAAHAKIERTLEKTFTVSGAGALTVETQGGNIRVEPGSGGEVTVVAIQKFRTNDESEADEIAKNLRISIAQSGNDVSAIAKYEGSRRGGWFQSWPPVNVEFVVTVPQNYSASLRTSGGNLQVGDLTGQVNGRTSGGNIELGKIQGQVDVKTSGGNIDIEEVRDSLEADTSGGNIRVRSARAKSRLHTSGGNIRIDSGAESVDAETSGGNVYARLETDLKGDCSLRTSGGEITIEVPNGAKFSLDASTSGGSVRLTGADIAIESGQNGKSKLVGKVNGGGPAVRLRSSGGDVRIAAK